MNRGKTQFQTWGVGSWEKVWSKTNNPTPFFRQTKNIKYSALWCLPPLLHFTSSSWGELGSTSFDSSPKLMRSTLSLGYLNVVHRPVLNYRWPPHEQTSKVSHPVVSTNYLADSVSPSFPFPPAVGIEPMTLHMLSTCSITVLYIPILGISLDTEDAMSTCSTIQDHHLREVTVIEEMSSLISISILRV